jgi:hypothetical protein
MESIGEQVIMKREDLKKLLGESATDELIDKIMAEHGKDVEKSKSDLAAVTTERDGLKSQLTEAGKTIDGFKKLEPEKLQAAVDEWKAKAEQAEQTAQAELAKLKFDHALDGALSAAKGKNGKAIRASMGAGAGSWQRYPLFLHRLFLEIDQPINEPNQHRAANDITQANR